jgi:hypothetical protein
VTGNNVNEWPVQELTLGTRLYSADELCSIFQLPASGNGLVALAHQLIAAKLNFENGADHDDIDDEVAYADSLIDGLVIPPVGTGFLEPRVTGATTDALTDYNEGGTSVPHCT